MSAVLAHDPAVPQRDAVLDPARVAGLVGSSGGTRVRATYRVGRRLRALHSVPDGRLVAAVTPARAGGVYAPALDASLWVYPHDRKLTALPALAAAGPALRSELGRRWAASELVAWAPEKSATVRCVDERGRTVAYAKTYRGDGEAAARRHELLAARTDGSVRLPRVLAWAPEHATLFLEALPGRRLDGRSTADLHRLGAALARLHKVPPDGVARFDRLDGGRLTVACELLGRARPDVAAAAGELVAELESRRPPPGPAGLLHGDAHAKNALVEGGRVGLVDLDQAAAGPPAAELGGALARLRYERCAGALGPDEADALARALLAGYASAGEVPARDALVWHTAAALLVERALRAVHRVRVPGLLCLDAVVADARSLLS